MWFQLIAEAGKVLLLIAGLIFLVEACPSPKVEEDLDITTLSTTVHGSTIGIDNKMFSSNIKLYILEDVNMRAKPSLDSEVIHVLKRGTEVVLIDSRVESDIGNYDFAAIAIPNKDKNFYWDLGYSKKKYIGDYNQYYGIDNDYYF